MPEFYASIASVLSVLAFLPYIKDTLGGVTRPERASWLIWSVLSTISFFSQLHEGARLSLMFAGSQVAITVSVFLLSIKLGHGHYFSDINKILYAIASIGLLTSFVSDSAIYALVVAIAISLMGGMKTVFKAFRNPHTETVLSWFVALLASVFGAMSVGSLDPVLLAYPLYLVVVYSAIIVAIIVGRWWPRRHRPVHSRQRYRSEYM